MAYIHCAASCCLGRPRPAVQHKQGSAGAQPGLSQRLLQHAGCCRIHNGNVFLAFHSCTNDVGAVGGQGGGTVSWLGLCMPCLRQVTVSQCGSSCLDVSCSRQRLHCKVQHGAGRHALDCRCAGLLGAPPTPGTKSTSEHQIIHGRCPDKQQSKYSNPLQPGRRQWAWGRLLGLATQGDLPGVT